MDGILTKISYVVFQVLKLFFMKMRMIQPLDLLFLVFLLAFTLADIIFHKFLEVNSTLSEKKKIFVTNFHFLTYPLTRLTTKIRLA